MKITKIKIKNLWYLRIGSGICGVIVCEIRKNKI